MLESIRQGLQEPGRQEVSPRVSVQSISGRNHNYVRCLSVDGDPDQKTSLLREEIEERDNSDEETRFFQGALSGTLISLPSGLSFSG